MSGSSVSPKAKRNMQSSYTAYASTAYASNKLYSGEITDFRQAVSLLRDAMVCEGKEDPAYASYWQIEVDRCDKALAIYETHYQEFLEEFLKNASEALRQEGLSEFADGLESGDYSILAY